jgi:hypothetical protein
MATTPGHSAAAHLLLTAAAAVRAGGYSCRFHSSKGSHTSGPGAAWQQQLRSRYDSGTAAMTAALQLWQRHCSFDSGTAAMTAVLLRERRCPSRSRGIIDRGLQSVFGGAGLVCVLNVVMPLCFLACLWERQSHLWVAAELLCGITFCLSLEVLGGLGLSACFVCESSVPVSSVSVPWCAAPIPGSLVWLGGGECCCPAGGK